MKKVKMRIGKGGKARKRLKASFPHAVEPVVETEYEGEYGEQLESESSRPKTRRFSRMVFFTLAVAAALCASILFFGFPEFPQTIQEYYSSLLVRYEFVSKGDNDDFSTYRNTQSAESAQISTNQEDLAVDDLSAGFEGDFGTLSFAHLLTGEPDKVDKEHGMDKKKGSLDRHKKAGPYGEALPDADLSEPSSIPHSIGRKTAKVLWQLGKFNNMPRDLSSPGEKGEYGLSSSPMEVCQIKSEKDLPKVLKMRQSFAFKLHGLPKDNALRFQALLYTEESASKPVQAPASLKVIMNGEIIYHEINSSPTRWIDVYIPRQRIYADTNNLVLVNESGKNLLVDGFRIVEDYATQLILSVKDGDSTLDRYFGVRPACITLELDPDIPKSDLESHSVDLPLDADSSWHRRKEVWESNSRKRAWDAWKKDMPHLSHTIDSWAKRVSQVFSIGAEPVISLSAHTTYPQWLGLFDNFQYFVRHWELRGNSAVFQPVIKTMLSKSPVAIAISPMGCYQSVVPHDSIILSEYEIGAWRNTCLMLKRKLLANREPESFDIGLRCETLGEMQDYDDIVSLTPEFCTSICAALSQRAGHILVDGGHTGEGIFVDEFSAPQVLRAFFRDIIGMAGRQTYYWPCNIIPEDGVGPLRRTQFASFKTSQSRMVVVVFSQAPAERDLAITLPAQWEGVAHITEKKYGLDRNGFTDRTVLRREVTSNRRELSFTSAIKGFSLIEITRRRKNQRESNPRPNYLTNRKHVRLYRVSGTETGAWERSLCAFDVGVDCDVLNNSTQVSYCTAMPSTSRKALPLDKRSLKIRFEKSGHIPAIRLNLYGMKLRDTQLLSFYVFCPSVDSARTFQLGIASKKTSANLTLKAGEWSRIELIPSQFFDADSRLSSIYLKGDPRYISRNLEQVLEVNAVKASGNSFEGNRVGKMRIQLVEQDTHPFLFVTGEPGNTCFSSTTINLKKYAILNAEQFVDFRTFPVNSEGDVRLMATISQSTSENVFRVKLKSLASESNNTETKKRRKKGRKQR